METLRELIRHSCAEYRDRTAFVDAEDGARLTFGEFEDYSNQVANALRDTGVRALDSVAVLAENCMEWPVVEAGIAKLGAVCVPINYRLSAGEISYQLRHSNTTQIIASPKFVEVAVEAMGEVTTDVRLMVLSDPPESGKLNVDTAYWDRVVSSSTEFEFTGEVQPQSPQRLAYTSATTGEPKGVLCPHVHICDNARAILGNQLSDLTPDDAYLAATPLTHMAMGYAWPVFLCGARTVIARSYRPGRFAADVDRYGATHTLMTPTMVVMLLEHLRVHPAEVDLLRRGTLRGLWYAGAGMPVAVAREAERVLGSVLGQQYGFMELFSASTCMNCTYLPPEEHNAKIGSVGRPLDGAEVVVLDEAGKRLPPGEVGEISVRASLPVGGYLSDPTQSALVFAGNWIRSGDIGKFDDDGYLYITDRVKDMIISGGFNIYSAEVENVIYEHPAVLECAVVAAPDEKWGEVPWAFVVLRSSAPATTETEIIEWVRQRIARFKAPSKVMFREALPKSQMGKILKRSLRDTQISTPEGPK